MVKKRGLGKSLDALLAYTDDKKSPELKEVKDVAAEEPTGGRDSLKTLPVERLQRGKYQPRRDMDPESLEDLANSIRQQGIIQPLVVRSVGDSYEIIAGERRWRAAQLAGLHEVPVIIRDIPDEAAIAIALIENIQRENLNPIEEAIALQRLIDEFGMTHQLVAEAVGKSRATVSNLLRLLALPDEVKAMLEKGSLEMGHARTLITLPESQQLSTAQMIVAQDLSVRETEHLVRRLQGEQPEAKKSKRPQDPDILNLQKSLSLSLGTKVAVQCNAKGKGKVVIHYRNLSELDELVEQLKELQPV